MDLTHTGMIVSIIFFATLLYAPLYYEVLMTRKVLTDILRILRERDG
jgi:hypothetical protein